MPQATVHSSLVAEAWLAWHSMQRSMMWFLKVYLMKRYMMWFLKIRPELRYGRVSKMYSMMSSMIMALKKNYSHILSKWRKITCRWHNCPPQCPKPTVQQHSTSSPDAHGMNKCLKWDHTILFHLKPLPFFARGSRGPSTTTGACLMVAINLHLSEIISFLWILTHRTFIQTRKSTDFGCN